MRSRLGMLAGLAASALVVGSAQAAPPPCGATRDLMQALRGSYGELPISTGLQANGQLLQIFASPQTGSWTAITTSPRGMSCVLATGRRWSDGSERPSPVSPPVALRP